MITKKFKTFRMAALTMKTSKKGELYWFLLELFTKHDPQKLD